jgi:hypothetical protein
MANDRGTEKQGKMKTLFIAFIVLLLAGFVLSLF